MAFVRFVAKPEDVMAVVAALRLPDAAIDERIASKQEPGKEIISLRNRYQQLPRGISRKFWEIERRGLAKITDYTGMADR